jgi:hypothetical protein
VLFELPLAQLFQNADFPISFDQRHAAAFDLLLKAGALIAEQLAARLEHQRVAVHIEQLIHVDAPGPSRDLAAPPHLVLLGRQAIDLVVEQSLGVISLRQFQTPLAAIGLPQLEHGLQAKLKSWHFGPCFGLRYSDFEFLRRQLI